MPRLEHPTAYARQGISVDNSTTVALTDFGFTEEQIKQSDAAHISVVSGGGVLYTYATNDTINSSSITHVIPLNGERIVYGLRNLRALKIVAQAETTAVAITLATYGKYDFN